MNQCFESFLRSIYGSFANRNNSTLSSSSSSCSPLVVFFLFNNRSISRNDLKVWTIPPINGNRLRKINMETIIAAVESATSGVTRSVNLARRDAKMTAKLLNVSAKTCWQEHGRDKVKMQKGCELYIFIPQRSHPRVPRHAQYCTHRICTTHI